MSDVVRRELEEGTSKRKRGKNIEIERNCKTDKEDRKVMVLLLQFTTTSYEDCEGDWSAAASLFILPYVYFRARNYRRLW